MSAAAARVCRSSAFAQRCMHTAGAKRWLHTFRDPLTRSYLPKLCVFDRLWIDLPSANLPRLYALHDRRYRSITAITFVRVLLWIDLYASYSNNSSCLIGREVYLSSLQKHNIGLAGSTVSTCRCWVTHQVLAITFSGGHGRILSSQFELYISIFEQQ